MCCLYILEWGFFTCILCMFGAVCIALRLHNSQLRFFPPTAYRKQFDIMIGCVGVHVSYHTDMINLTTLQHPSTHFRMMSLCPRRLDLKDVIGLVNT